MKCGAILAPGDDVLAIYPKVHNSVN
jgi:hypothetical protein